MRVVEFVAYIISRLRQVMLTRLSPFAQFSIFLHSSNAYYSSDSIFYRQSCWQGLKWYKPEIETATTHGIGKLF